jgi:gamma-glutamylcyclotransferase (GGCT)/AIG2-like uncharacterized protein YtfP
MNLPGRYAFYGSLRDGLENHIGYASSLKRVGITVIPGYKMYSLHEYPYAVRTGDETNLIVAELFEITDAETEQMIYEMEIDAGYILSEVVIDNTIFGIFLFEQPDPAHPFVAHGDWRLYLEQSRF